MKKIVTTKEVIVECESCSDVLKSSNPKIKEKDYWENTDSRIICNDCMLVPLDVLKEVYVLLKKNNINPAIERIKEFDEEVEGGFLNKD